MSGPLARIGGFAVALALIFGATVGIGSAVGPTNRAEKQEAEGDGHAEDAMAMEEGEHGSGPQGLAVANDEFRLVADTAGFQAGQTRTFRFRIVDTEGNAVRDFDVEHEKKLHLIVVRRDATRYLHVHPTERADGTWTVPLRLADPGTYRVFADFTATGSERTTLGTDLTVPGDATPEPLPAPVRTVSVDGYDVAIGSRREAGDERELSFTVTREGRAVAVEPYLGADGHLVVLREGDLAYLHAHPEEDGEGDAIRFMVDYPSTGRYRLFLQFKHEGKVHTAAFTQEVE